MKNIILATFLGISIFATGCTNNQVEQTPDQQEETQINYILSNDLFSLLLPAPYLVENNVIKPEKGNGFPEITFDTLSGVPTDKTILQFEEDWVLQYGGKIVTSEDGYSNQYHYYITNGDKTFRAWTSADNFNNPSETEKAFDKIIETVKFK